MMPRKSIEEGLNISITFDTDMATAARLKNYAKSVQRSKAAVVRLALEAYLTNLEVK